MVSHALRQLDPDLKTHVLAVELCQLLEVREILVVPFTRYQQRHGHLLLGGRQIDPINLYIPASITKATGARRALAGTAENITGLHLGKVALITGGSAGIGGALARLLALAGAKVMMVARRESELDAAREAQR